MTKRTRIQQIKLFIKISIVVLVFGVFIVVGLIVRPTPSHDNANIKKWRTFNSAQKMNTVNRIISGESDVELLIKCVDKIAQLPDSDKFQIRDAVSICFSGIKSNEE